MGKMGWRLALISLLAIAGALYWVGIGCSGDSHDPTLEGNLLRYTQADMASFRLSGSAVCDGCDGEEFSGLYVELISRLSPTTRLDMGMFDGLGTLSFGELRAVAGSTVDVYGTLFVNAVDEDSALNAQTSFEVPEEDGGYATFVLRFTAH